MPLSFSPEDGNKSSSWNTLFWIPDNGQSQEFSNPEFIGYSSLYYFILVSLAGWVCYAEKTHGNLVLPNISTTKSPQQIMGSLVKYHLASQLSRIPDSVYHVTLMPCYDKKLEASREQFFNQQLQTRDVDCVITAGEWILNFALNILCILLQRLADLFLAAALIGCKLGWCFTDFCTQTVLDVWCIPVLPIKYSNLHSRMSMEALY